MRAKMRAVQETHLVLFRESEIASTKFAAPCTVARERCCADLRIAWAKQTKTQSS